jgi:hypothetical protein
MFTGFTAEEIASLKTDGVAMSHSFDFYGNGKPRLVVTTEPSHRLRRTTKYEGRNGEALWTLQGEYVAFGPRSSVWISYRYSQHPEALAWVNVTTWKQETATFESELWSGRKAA